ncbi:11084_t:CDS:1, partial [Ambispora leptoticha]
SIICKTMTARTESSAATGRVTSRIPRHLLRRYQLTGKNSYRSTWI